MVLLALTLVPAINLTLGNSNKLANAHKKEGEKWWSRSALYNLDFALPYLGRFFYPLGISMAPNQVLIGKNNWLYLGDQYAQTITTTRGGSTDEDLASARTIGLATKAWEQWLKLKGVRLYQVMLGPDKATIYPEFLPDWAQPAANSATDTLLANVSPGLYVDTRAALRAAKSEFSEPLYFKTDTHWNDLGAWVAYRAFAKELDRPEEGLRWLSDQQVRVTRVQERSTGDLAGFLRMTGLLQESEVVTEIDRGRPIETEQYDFDTGQRKAVPAESLVSYTALPLLVKSRHALNQKRVLWLRDSFGDAMSPLMAATFSETLQYHYIGIEPILFARLVDTFKPDYVFITTVERNARTEFFRNPPPPVTSGKPKNFTALSHGSQSGMHDLSKAEGTQGYRMTGADPFLTFTLSNPIRTQDASQLVFDLNCGEKMEPIQGQVFWQTAGMNFNESQSVRFETKPGMITLELAPLPAWTQAGTVTALRIDIDSPKTCPVLAVHSLEIGK